MASRFLARISALVCNEMAEGLRSCCLLPSAVLPAIRLIISTLGRFERGSWHSYERGSWHSYAMQGSMTEAMTPDMPLSRSLAALNATVQKIADIYNKKDFPAENERATAELQRILEFIDQGNAVIREQARQFPNVSEVVLGERNPAPQAALILCGCIRNRMMMAAWHPPHLRTMCRISVMHAVTA